MTPKERAAHISFLDQAIKRPYHVETARRFIADQIYLAEQAVYRRCAQIAVAAANADGVKDDTQALQILINIQEAARE